MASIVTTKFKHYNANQFKEAFGESSPSVIYLMIGKSTPWTDDLNPPVPSDTVSGTAYTDWDSLYAGKRINSTDASLCTRRIDWTSGTVYAEYSDVSESFYSSDYYVITDEYNVYKCLSNNGGAVSTSKPAGTVTTRFTSADGYVWKYMLTVTAAEAFKFVTNDYIPVKRILADDSSLQWAVQSAAIDGSIDIVNVTGGGSGYSDTKTGNVVSVANSTVITLPSGGLDDQYVGSVLHIQGGTGAGQQREISAYTASSGEITFTSALTTTPDATSVFDIGPKITISGDGTGATAVATVNSTSSTVESITVTAEGSGYSYGNVTITANNGTSSTATAIIPPPGGHGSNPVEELSAYNVILNTRLDATEGGKFVVTNDFRNVLLIEDPQYANGDIATTGTIDQTTTLSFDSLVGTFSLDEQITGGTSGATADVVSANTTVLKVTSVLGSFTTTEQFTGGTSGATANVVSTTSGDLQKHTGNILYKENKSPISRASDQIENVRLVIKY